MANPTALVPSAVTPYSETVFKHPAIGGATVAKTYQTGEMIGRRSDGYCGSFDDTADMTFLGLLHDSLAPVQVTADIANGATLLNIDRPYRIEVPLLSGTVSIAADYGKPMYAADSGHCSLSPGTFGNVIGTLVGVSGVGMPHALTGANAVIELPPAYASTGNALTTGAGAGITAGVGTVYTNSVTLEGSMIVTRIFIDLTGLSSSTTDLDIIGVGLLPAHIGRITAAQNGTVDAVRVTCLELPAGGADDIDLYSATEATGVFDQAITALIETALLTSGGAWANGTVKAATVVPAANQYLYLTGGEAGTVAEYTAGKFLIEIFGH